MRIIVSFFLWILVVLIVGCGSLSSGLVNGVDTIDFIDVVDMELIGDLGIVDMLENDDVLVIEEVLDIVDEGVDFN